jgi:hypothetical protein
MSGFSDYNFSSDEEDLREAMRKYQINKNKIKAYSANKESIADIRQMRTNEAKKRYKYREHKMLSKEIVILRRMVDECESKDPLSDLKTLSIEKLPIKRSVRSKEFEGEIGFELTKALKREGLDIFRKYEGEDYPEFIKETLEGTRQREIPRLDFEIAMINCGQIYNKQAEKSGKQAISYQVISDHESNTLIVRQADVISIKSSSSVTIPSPSDRNSSISSPNTYEEDKLYVPPPDNSYQHPTSITISSPQAHQDDTIVNNPTPSILTQTSPIPDEVNLHSKEPDSHTTPSSNKLDQKPGPQSIISISDSSVQEDVNISDLDLNSDSNSSRSLESSPKPSDSYKTTTQANPLPESSSPSLQGKSLNTLIRESLYATLPSSLYLHNRAALIGDLFRIAIEYYPSFLYYHNLLSNPIIQYIQFKRSPASMIHITLNSSSGQYSGIDLNLSNHSVKFCKKKDHNLH